MENRIWDFHHFVNQDALVEDSGEKVTYRQMVSIGMKLCRQIGHRCLVFIFCENCIGSIIGYVSFLNQGMVPVMLSSSLEHSLVENLLQTYMPSYLWVPVDKANEFKGQAEIELYGYRLLRTNYGKEYPLYEKLALLLTTSGSTGSPKFVRQSYENIRANTESIVEYLDLDSGERPITTLPMNYTYGLSIINTHLAVGATILLTNKGFMQKGFWEFFNEQGATSFGGVPYTYEMLDKLRFYHMDLPSLRTMTQAGGKLTPKLHEIFAQFAADTGRKFVVMYGQCEATARMGYLPAEKAAWKKGSMGIAVPGGTFTLLDVDGREIHTPHTAGELVYEGANVTLGYAECGEDLRKGDERNGRLATGDIAEFDEDGFYYIVGRKKRFLKIYGNRVNLDEVERLIKEKFGIEAACAGVDDHMYIFLTDEKRSDLVRDYVIKKTGLNLAAFQTVAIGSIPKNDSGKTQYTELSKYYEEV